MESQLATPDERAANERALARLFKLFPRLPKAKVGDFLIECTAYPFAPLAYCIEQAAELSRRCSKSVERAYFTSYRDLDRAMRRLNRDNPPAS